jgi:hypothetical protein
MGKSMGMSMVWVWDYGHARQCFSPMTSLEAHRGMGMDMFITLSPTAIEWLKIGHVYQPFSTENTRTHMGICMGMDIFPPKLTPP